MTEEKNQALIEYCKEEARLKREHIARLEKHMPGQFNLTKYQMELQVAEIALASLTAQPIGRVDRGEVSDNNEYPNARVVCLDEQADWENFQDGTELFLRPAPAADLAELVPEKASMADYYENVRSGEIDPEEAGIAMWDACRAAILRNIEETK